MLSRIFKNRFLDRRDLIRELDSAPDKKRVKQITAQVAKIDFEERMESDEDLKSAWEIVETIAPGYRE